MALQHKIFRMGTAVVNGYAVRIQAVPAERVSVQPGTGDDGENLTTVVDNVVQRRIDMVRRESKSKPTVGAAACGMANSLSFGFNLGVVAAQGKRSFTANGLR